MILWHRPSSGCAYCCLGSDYGNSVEDIETAVRRNRRMTGCFLILHKGAMPDLKLPATFAPKKTKAYYVPSEERGPEPLKYHRGG